jgi:hypothetical protein
LELKIVALFVVWLLAVISKEKRRKKAANRRQMAKALSLNKDDRI